MGDNVGMNESEAPRENLGPQPLFPPPAAEAGPVSELPDPRVPGEGDWNVRPYSESEHYVEPGIEAAFARDWPVFIPQVPSLLSLVFALLGFLPGVWGVAAATFAMGLGALAIATPGSTRHYSAWAGFALGLAWLFVHALAPR